MHKDMTRDEMLLWRMIDAYFEPDDFGPDNNGLRYHGKMQSIMSSRLKVGLLCCTSGYLVATIYVDFEVDEQDADSIDGVPNGWEVESETFEWENSYEELLSWIDNNGLWQDVVKKYKEFEQKCL